MMNEMKILMDEYNHNTEKKRYENMNDNRINNEIRVIIIIIFLYEIFG